MVMSGPGVTNLISAVAECYYQSIPIVVITVDNPKKNLGIEDFHEVDSFTMLGPITKKMASIENAMIAPGRHTIYAGGASCLYEITSPSLNTAGRIGILPLVSPAPIPKKNNRPS